MSLSFEISFDDDDYLIELEGQCITILKVTSAIYANYAMGTWVPAGGYGRYLFDNERSSYDWKLLDFVDETLRVKTDFRSEPPSTPREIQRFKRVLRSLIS